MFSSPLSSRLLKLPSISSLTANMPPCYAQNEMFLFPLMFFFFCDWFRVYVETYLNSWLVQVTCLLKSLLKNLKPYANRAYFFPYRCQMFQKITGCGHRRELSICTCLKGWWRAKAGVIYGLMVVSPKRVLLTCLLVPSISSSAIVLWTK